MAKIPPGSHACTKALLAGVLVVGGCELFFRAAEGGAGQRWSALAVVGLGVLLLGATISARPKLGAILGVLIALAVSGYMSVTAFFRFRGLAKDLEASPSALIHYGGKIFLAFLLAVSVSFAGTRVMAALRKRTSSQTTSR